MHVHKLQMVPLTQHIKNYGILFFLNTFKILFNKFKATQHVPRNSTVLIQDCTSVADTE